MSSPCKEMQEKIADYVLGVLSQKEIDALDEHISSCAACRQYVQALEDQKRSLLRLGEKLEADMAIRRDRVIEALNHYSPTARIKVLSIWRTIMKSPITKLAAAAVIIIAVIIGIHQFGGSDMAGVAWADIARKVEQIQTLTFRLRVQMTGTPDAEIMVYDSSEYGSRMDTYIEGKIMSLTYAPKGENAFIMVVPEAKKYTRMTFTEEQLRQMRAKEKDPREFIKLFMSEDYTELGRDTIDGIEVEGIEVDSPKIGGGMFESAVGRLWVDVETEWPVRMEIEGASGGGSIETKMVVDEFQWDVELDASLFEPNIPDDYTLLGGEVKLPEINEGVMIQGLRVFAEIADGRYPSSLTVMTAMKELQEAWKKKYDRQPTNEEQQKFSSVYAACQFYGELVQEDKDVEYYGDTVTADDLDAVLMRWRISEDEFRVIYGDLRIENVVDKENDDKEKALDIALKMSGKKLSADKRGVVMRMLSLNEKDLFKGLAVWVELLDGRYPSSLEPEKTIPESDALLKAKYDEGLITEKQAKQKGEDVFFASVYYNRLIRRKKDPAYYGGKVTVEDSNAVLMRWKISDDKYRIIFGDLTTENVTAEELSELEKLSSE